MDLLDTARFLKDYGWMAISILLVLGGMREVYVWGGTFRRVLRERDEAVSRADRMQDILTREVLNAGRAFRALQHRRR